MVSPQPPSPCMSVTGPPQTGPPQNGEQPVLESNPTPRDETEVSDAVADSGKRKGGCQSIEREVRAVKAAQSADNFGVTPSSSD